MRPLFSASRAKPSLVFHPARRYSTATTSRDRDFAAPLLIGVMIGGKSFNLSSGYLDSNFDSLCLAVGIWLGVSIRTDMQERRRKEETRTKEIDKIKKINEEHERKMELIYLDHALEVHKLGRVTKFTPPREQEPSPRDLPSKIPAHLDAAQLRILETMFRACENSKNRWGIRDDCGEVYKFYLPIVFSEHWLPYREKLCKEIEAEKGNEEDGGA